MLARILLLPPKSVHPSLFGSAPVPEDTISWPVTLSWWAARVLLVHQRVLSELSPSLRKLLVPLAKLNLSRFGNPSTLDKSGWAYGLDSEKAKAACRIVSAEVLIEVGLMEITYGHLEEAK